jgi:hypothetical protein
MARWAVTLIHKKGENPGVIDAPNERPAVAKVAQVHNIPPALRNKIVVTKLDTMSSR